MSEQFTVQDVHRQLTWKKTKTAGKVGLFTQKAMNKNR